MTIPIARNTPEREHYKNTLNLTLQVDPHSVYDHFLQHIFTRGCERCVMFTVTGIALNRCERNWSITCDLSNS